MSIVGLFAGIGGMELGLARSGFHTSLLCDVLPTSQAVLAARFPHVPYHHDVTTLRALPANTELLCAGFPCQDLSQAGRTAGLEGERSGLIGEVFRLLRRKRVKTVVVENVPFMLQLNGGGAIRAIVDEFERLGYRWAYRVVDTFGFGLPQRRERVFLVASKVLDPAEVLLSDEAKLSRPSTALGQRAHGFYWTEGRGGLGWAVDAVPTLKNGSTIGIPSPPAILMPDGRLVKPSIRDAERLQGFDADWTSPAESVAKSSSRWGLVGSAISVPVATWIGTRLNAPCAYDRQRDRPFPESGKAPRAARFDGKTRYAVDISVDPIGLLPPPLSGFLEAPTTLEPLSLKATLGFLNRTRQAKLRFADGFIHAVEAHARQMTTASMRGIGARQLDLLEAVS